ncbi:MAG: ParA family protein [Deltaproteobacteria bacterium]|nr:ParA family protein [Deltaproteobacteria bacterium]
MTQIFSISNQKGGVGKTTTAVNLSASLAAAEYSTLLVDLDPQGNSCSGLGIQKNQFTKSVYHVLIDQAQFSDIILPTDLDFLWIAPSNSDLVAADIELVSKFSREYKLKTALKLVKEKYDFVIIDCPPSLNLLTVNALSAADSVIVPVQCEYYALEGLSDLLKTINLIRDHLNPSLEIEGILLTMFDARNNLAHQVSQEIRKYFPEKIFKSVVPRNVKLGESPSHGKPILLYDIRSKGALAYLDLAQEIILRYQKINVNNEIINEHSVLAS